MQLIIISLFIFYTAFFAAMVNSFVHVFMYSYYALAAANLHKYIFWKKYLTIMQMVIQLIASQPLAFDMISVVN